MQFRAEQDHRRAWIARSEKLRRCLLLAVIATVVVVVLWEIVSRVPDDGTTAAEAVFALPPRGGSTGAAKFSVGLHGHRGPASNISYTV